MDNLTIAAASGLRSRMESLDLLANNLANTATAGFKRDLEFYGTYSSSDSNDPINGGASSILPTIEKQWTDFSQGNLIDTANPLDVAIDGEGLFAVQTAGGVRYTRNGNFRIGPTGVLVAGDGSPVRAQGGGSIALQPGVRVEVLADGTVQQDGQPVGQLELSAFDRGSMDKSGANYFVPLDGVTAKPATGVVVQRKLEQSNVGAAESSVRLVAIMRQFEMLQKAMNIGNELNRKAIEEVARVVT